MKEFYLRLPNVLKKELAIRLGTSALSLFLFIMVLILSKDMLLALPCMIFSILMLVKGAVMFYSCITGNCLEIKGLCSYIELTAFRRKIKSLTVNAENKTLKIPVNFRLKGINVGDTITVYLSKSSHLYYNNGIYNANAIYALSVTKEAVK